MNFVHHHKHIIRAVLLVACGLAPLAPLRAADASADAPPAPAPAAAPAASGNWYVFSPPKEGVVLATPSREKLLALTKAFMARTSPSQLARVRDASNPFFPKLPPPSESTGPTGPSTPAAPAIPQVSPVEKLQQVADQIKPTGSLIGGQSRFIVFANGDTLAVGQSLHVNFPGENTPTEIILQDVSADSFTLKIGDNLKAFPYFAKENAQRSNLNNSSSQPKKP